MNASQAIRRDVKRTIQRKVEEYVRCIVELVQQEPSEAEHNSLLGLCAALRKERREAAIEWGRRRVESLFAEVEQCCLDAVAEYCNPQAAKKLYESLLTPQQGEKSAVAAKPGKGTAEKNQQLQPAEEPATKSEPPSATALTAFLGDHPAFMRVHPEHRHKLVFQHSSGGHVLVSRQGNDEQGSWRALRQISTLTGTLHVVRDGHIETRNGAARGA